MTHTNAASLNYPLINSRILSSYLSLSSHLTVSSSERPPARLDENCSSTVRRGRSHTPAGTTSSAFHIHAKANQKTSASGSASFSTTTTKNSTVRREEEEENSRSCSSGSRRASKKKLLAKANSRVELQRRSDVLQTVPSATGTCVLPSHADTLSSLPSRHKQLSTTSNEILKHLNIQEGQKELNLKYLVLFYSFREYLYDIFLVFSVLSPPPPDLQKIWTEFGGTSSFWRYFIVVL